MLLAPSQSLPNLPCLPSETAAGKGHGWLPLLLVGPWCLVPAEMWFPWPSRAEAVTLLFPGCVGPTGLYQLHVFSRLPFFHFHAKILLRKLYIHRPVCHRHQICFCWVIIFHDSLILAPVCTRFSFICMFIHTHAYTCIICYIYTHTWCTMYI